MASFEAPPERLSKFVTHQDPYIRFLKAIPYMVELARAAAEDDVFSYRNLRVGSAWYDENSSAGETGILAAGNLKRTAHVAKVCAEMKLGAKVIKSGFLDTVGVAVASSASKDEIRGITPHRPTPTLFCCDACVDVMSDNPTVKPETLIVATDLDSNIKQATTFGELRQWRIADQLGPDGFEVDTRPFDGPAMVDRYHLNMLVLDGQALASRAFAARAAIMGTLL